MLAVVTVNTLNDNVDFNDGLTSFREAIFATNLVGGADTINFAPSLTSSGPATILLTQGELKITDDLTITGPGANLLTIDASGNDPTPDSTLSDGNSTNDGDGSRIFNIDDGNFSHALDVSIGGLTLTGGDVSSSGGAIGSGSEILAVSNCVISGNRTTSSAGGISGRHIIVSGCTISGNAAKIGGGGILDFGDLTVTGSTISDNSAGGQGGGIFGLSDSRFSVVDSAVTGNTSQSSGGGIYGGTITVSGSSISGNTAVHGNGGGIFHTGNKSVLITDSVINDNRATGGLYSQGGGIDSPNGNLTVVRSTISGNSASLNGGGIYNGTTSVLYNINLTVTDSTISGNTAGAGAGITNAMAGALAISGSTFRDNVAVGLSLGTTFDGRPIKVGSGGGLLSRAKVTTVSSSTFSGNTAALGGGISFANFADATVSIADCTIRFNQAKGDGSNGGGILNGGGKLAVANSQIANNTAGWKGGGIFTSGDLAVTNTVVSDNAAYLIGGGLYCRNLTMNSSTISGNSAYDGGGICSTGNLAILDSEISDNSAGPNGTTLSTSRGRGGGIFQYNGTVSVTGSTISGNSAILSGGGIFGFKLTVDSSTIRGNHANGNGGGIYGSGSLAVSNSTIAGNGAYDIISGNGGGIFFSAGDLSVLNSTISGNFAKDSGGGLYSLAAAPSIRHSTVAANHADNFGGGVFFGDGALTLSHTIIATNDSKFGPDVTGLFGGTIDAKYNLIGTNKNSPLAEAPVGSPDANGNLIGGPVHGLIDPKLGPLTNNGGPTDTCALQPSSPAIDAGDPAAVAGLGDVPEFDQRGTPFARVLDGDGPNGARIDIGAVEVLSLTSIANGDYNGNGVVDAADYTVYADTYGSATDLRADGNGNGIVDDADRLVWISHFGQLLPVSLTGAFSGPVVPVSLAAEIQLRESVVLLPADTLTTPIQATSAAARTASFATLEFPIGSQELRTQRHGPTHRSQHADSSVYDMLLLAIDRVGRSTRRDTSVAEVPKFDDHGTNGHESACSVHVPLALALKEWR